MKLRKFAGFLCISALVLSLAACGKSDDEKVQPVESGHAPALAAQESSDQLAQLLAQVSEAQLGDVHWTGPNAPTPERLAALLARALEHPAQPDPDLPYYFGLWTAEFYLDDTLIRLDAGQEEALIRLQAEGSDSSDALYLEDQELYQLLRSVNDIPREVEESVYGACQGLIDHYYNTLLADTDQLDGGFDRWVLHILVPAAERPDLGAKAYQMTAALYAPTPEIAVRQLAGGMVLDSQLRTFGIPQQTAYLVTVDDKPAGILPCIAGREPEHVLEDYADLEDLSAAFWSANGK